MTETQRTRRAEARDAVCSRSKPGSPPPRSGRRREALTLFAMMSRPRVLLIGLGYPSHGDDGIGVYLARSLRDAFNGIEVLECPGEPPPFFEILHDFDLLILIDSVRFCDTVGRVYVGTPTSLSELKGAPTRQTRALDDAVSYARLTGARTASIRVIGVCVPDEDTVTASLSPQVADKYDSIVTRVRSCVKEILRDANAAAAPSPRRV